MEKPGSEEHPMREDYGIGLPDTAVVADEHFAIRDKSPELKQAQVAAFAAERLTHSADAKHVFNNIAQIADSDPSVVQRTLTKNEYLDQTMASKILAGTEREVATRADYAAYLSEVGGSGSEQISWRAGLLGRYKSEFEPAIQSLIGELGDAASRDRNPPHLGSGGTSDAFSMSHEGEEYAVRLLAGEEPNPSAIDDYIQVGMRAAGIPHLEQIVAASYETGVTVAELMPGTQFDNLKAEKIKHVTFGQLRELVDTIMAANDAGLRVDPKVSNFFYDEDAGFGIIDCLLRDESDGVIVGLPETLSAVAGLVGGMGRTGSTDSINSSVEDFESTRDNISASLPLLTQFRTICQERFVGEEGVTLTAEINERIQWSEESLRNHSNPEWVAARVDEARLAQQERETIREGRRNGEGDEGTAIPLDVL